MRVFAWREAPAADFAVIGDPVSHSKSPQMHEAAYRHLGLDDRYVAIHVPPGEVSPALDHLAGLGYRGVNVTVPHKEAALDWCRIQEPLAKRVRAANTIRFADRSCINTDAPGFLDTLDDLPLPNRRVLLLGAGGSARAIAVALVNAGYELGIWNRTRSNAQMMLEQLELDAQLLSEPSFAGAGMVVNSTSSSLQGDLVPVEWNTMDSQAVAYDLMYATEATPFMRAAASHGFRTVDGRPLLAAQGARSFAYWLGVPGLRHVMLRALQ